MSCNKMVTLQSNRLKCSELVTRHKCSCDGWFRLWRSSNWRLRRAHAAAEKWSAHMPYETWFDTLFCTRMNPVISHAWSLSSLFYGLLCCVFLWQHFFVSGRWKGDFVMRPYTPVTGDEVTGFVDLVIKVKANSYNIQRLPEGRIDSIKSHSELDVHPTFANFVSRIGLDSLAMLFGIQRLA